MKLNAPRCLASLFLASCLLAACAGPRAKRLDARRYPPRPSIYPIEIFVGQVIEPHREIAILESGAYSADVDSARLGQIEELKKKARRLGADAVQDVRVLPKKVKGYTIDERTPFPSWKQGDYSLYFMRGTAIIYESSLPGAVTDGVASTSPSGPPSATPR